MHWVPQSHETVKTVWALSESSKNMRHAALERIRLCWMDNILFSWLSSQFSTHNASFPVTQLPRFNPTHTSCRLDLKKSSLPSRDTAVDRGNPARFSRDDANVGANVKQTAVEGRLFVDGRPPSSTCDDDSFSFPCQKNPKNGALALPIVEPPGENSRKYSHCFDKFIFSPSTLTSAEKHLAASSSV